jgi:ubiquitin-activating enzyme E1
MCRCLVSAITGEENAVVTVSEEARHELEDGDKVWFEGCVGAEELNGKDPFPVTVLSPHSFRLPIDSRSFEKQYDRNGYVHQVRKSAVMDFDPLHDAYASPKISFVSTARMEYHMVLHIAYMALSAFMEDHDGARPRPYSTEDADVFMECVRSVNDEVFNVKEDLPEEFLRDFAMTCSGDLNPVAAFIGAVAAQEVLKACSGKFTPVDQFLYFEAHQALPTRGSVSEADAQPLNGRYDGQIAVFGRKFQQKLFDLSTFVVGAGALGCEYLKNFALMGMGCGEGKGEVCVTDMDRIEISNLNRQFLFRREHVGHMKADVAAKAARRMNTALRMRVYEDRVGSDTEDVFDDEFWDSLDVVCNALDNVPARLYVDGRCVLYDLPLLESGTLGPKANCQVIVPYETENYGNSRDAPETQYAICTIKNFPYAIQHTIQWARELFEGVFRQVPMDVNSYMEKGRDYLEDLKMVPAVRLGTLTAIHDALLLRPNTFDDCIVRARNMFEENFHNLILQLLHNFPPGATTSSGVEFWSGTKRIPTAMEFNAEDPLHLGFIIAAANLYAHVFGVEDATTDREYIARVASAMVVEEFRPSDGVKIAVDEKEEEAAGSLTSGGDSDCARFEALIPDPSAVESANLVPEEFEKDDDANFHIDFITAVSNLRARIYQIPEADHSRTKFIAGKIIPAMITTTAAIVGLASIELYKLVMCVPVADYANSFVNLALPFFGYSEPAVCEKEEVRGMEISMWSKLDVDIGDATMGEMFEYLEKTHKIGVEMCVCDGRILYSFFGNQTEMSRRMGMKLREVVELVGKCKLPPGKKLLLLEVTASDAETGEDVNIPVIRFRFAP